MSFLDIGPLELLVVLFLLLLVFGPNKLPGIATQIGKGIRKLKAASAEFTREMQAEAEGIKREEGKASSSQAELGRTVGEIVKEARSVGKELGKELSSATEDLKGFDRVAGEVAGELNAAPVPVAKAPSGKASSEGDTLA